MPGNEKFLRLHKKEFQKTAPHSNGRDMLQSKLPYSTHRTKKYRNKSKDILRTNLQYDALASGI